MSRYAYLDEPKCCPTCQTPLRRSDAPLTPKQAALYRFLYEYIDGHGFAPSFNEIAQQFGHASLATVHEHLTTLVRKGWLRRTYNEARAIECLVPIDLAHFALPSGGLSASTPGAER